MRWGIAAAAVVATSVATFAAASIARADETPEMKKAQSELDTMSSLFAASGNDCSMRCKALASMERAAERICELAEGGTSDDHARCESAKKKVEEAREVLRQDCPDCVNASPPPPNIVTTMPVEKKQPVTATTESASAYPPPRALADAEYRTAPANDRFLTARFSLLRPIEVPQFLTRMSFEFDVLDRASMSIHLGAGSVNVGGVFGDEGLSARSTTLEAGLEARGYILGTFSLGGLGLGLQLLETHLSLQTVAGIELPVKNSEFLVPGLTVAPLVAYKYVFLHGFTIDASLGASFVAHHERPLDPNERKVIPLADLAFGWTF